MNRANRSRPALQPIISNAILERIQIDLIDFRHEPDGQYQWVLHIKDHFSKFSTLYAQKSKQAIEVRDHLAVWIGFFGVPKIIQSDNGREFKEVLETLLKEHGIKIINGQPRSPQTQGAVEQSNSVVKSKLRT